MKIIRVQFFVIFGCSISSGEGGRGKTPMQERWDG